MLIQNSETETIKKEVVKMMQVTRTGRRWPLFAGDLLDFEGECNRLLGGWGREWGPQRYPPLNVWASEGEIVVDAELPGVDPKEVEISVEGNELTLAGQLDAGDKEKEGKYQVRERRSGSFRRVLELPYRIEAGKVKAQYRNGILSVRLPQLEKEQGKRRTIEIKTD